MSGAMMLNIRVAVFLLSDGGGWSMSAVNPCIVGQQFANGLQAMDDIIIRPEFEVGAANTHVKEGVARECQLFLLAIK